MEIEKFFFTGHAIQRMFERKIDEKEIISVIRQGEVVENYPDDNPYPSSLILGEVDDKPLHVVAAFDNDTGKCYIITVYNPNPELWESDFKKRKAK